MSGSLLSGAPILLNPALGAIGQTPLLLASDALGLNSESVLGLWSIVASNTPSASGGFNAAFTSLEAGNFSTALSTAQSAFAAIQPVISFDSVVDFSYEGDYSVCQYPIEGGSFQSYNKVIQPFAIKMTLALGGNFTVNTAISAAESGSAGGAFQALTGYTARAKFLNQIAAAQSSLTLLSVNTPDATYANLNVTHVDYDRNAAAGAKLLQVELWFEQIIVTATSTFSNTQSPTSVDPINSGQANPLQPSTIQQQAIGLPGAN